MSRPPKCRRVAFMPGVTYFKPAGIPLRFLGEVRLSIEEAEAVRLKDLEDLEQEQCAEKMGISRPTFQRVLATARQKIADALLNGKVIRIEGGNFEMAPLQFVCPGGHEWDVPYESTQDQVSQLCPECNAVGVKRFEHPIPGCERGRWGRRFRGGTGCQGDKP